MRRLLPVFTVAALGLAGGAHGQITDQFATGNMHFDAKAMDANQDGRITRDEAMSYGRNMWRSMAGGRKTIPVQEAAEMFARGNMRMNAARMDANHDGSISEGEFMSDVQRRFDRMKEPDGTLSVADAAKAFSRGNQSVASESARSAVR